MRQHRLLPFFLVGMFVLSFLTPLGIARDAAASEPEVVPTAFLESWDLQTTGVSLCSYNSQDDRVLGSCDTDEDYLIENDPSRSYTTDDEGNHYYSLAGGSGGQIGGTYSNSGSGIHIWKFDKNGTFVWLKEVSTSSNCNYDGSYCSVLGLHMVQEDEFYVVISLYNPGTVTFDSQTSLTLNGYNVVTAYYSVSGWMWAEAESTSSTPNQVVKDNRMDGDDNLYLTIFDGYSSNYREYSIVAYDANGGKWNRLLEIDQYTDDYNSILVDTEQSEIHFLLSTTMNLRYDSQTTSCPSGSYQNHCYVWMTIASTGVKTAATAIKSASMTPMNIEVVGSTLFLHGLSFDEYTNSDDGSFNLTGTPQNCIQDYCAFVTKVDRSAVWSGTKIINEQDEDDGLLWGNMAFEDDGSFVLSVLFFNGVSLYIDGVLMNQHQSKTYEFIIAKLDASFTLLWSTNFASNDIDGVGVMASSNNSVIFSYENSGNDAIVSNATISPSAYAFIAWISFDNGSIVDVEENVFARPIAILDGGGLLTRQAGANGNEKLQFYAPDFDNDNIGDDDNCPDVYNPSQADYDVDGIGDACDSDDDSDAVTDGADYCPLGAKGWISSSLTDHDGDGCKDSLEEDPDDDNDGHSDQKDDCPTGILGAGNDHDADGCKNTEDDDDDGDGINDGSDQCVLGDVDWLSGQVTDHDADGCRDLTEDSDDDNDGITDVADSCPKGEINWPSNANTDFDGDGCKDGYEDEDDDGDGVLNFEDECEDSIGAVTTNGCPVGSSNNNGNSSGNGNNGDGTQIYYVCPQGSLVVTDLSECPQSNDSASNTTTIEPQIYYVCPGGSSVVTDLQLCPAGTDDTSSQNITYVLDSNSNLSDDFTICPGGTAIVMDTNDCPNPDESTSTEEQQSSSSSTEPMIMFFAGGAFLLALMAVLLTLLRRPAPVQHYEQSHFDSSDMIFKTQPELPSTLVVTSPPIASKGSSRDGYEWIEWPENSGNHWYRTDGTSSDWSKYQE